MRGLVGHGKRLTAVDQMVDDFIGNEKQGFAGLRREWQEGMKGTGGGEEKVGQAEARPTCLPRFDFG